MLVNPQSSLVLNHDRRCMKTQLMTCSQARFGSAMMSRSGLMARFNSARFRKSQVTTPSGHPALLHSAFHHVHFFISRLCLGVRYHTPYTDSRIPSSINNAQDKERIRTHSRLPVTVQRITDLCAFTASAFTTAFATLASRTMYVESGSVNVINTSGRTCRELASSHSSLPQPRLRLPLTVPGLTHRVYLMHYHAHLPMRCAIIVHPPNPPYVSRSHFCSAPHPGRCPHAKHHPAYVTGYVNTQV